jgi:hypothetical protein
MGQSSIIRKAGPLLNIYIGGNDIDRRQQAQHDDELSSDSDSDNEDEENSQGREERREERRQKRLQKRRERIEYSKAMDMQYELSFPC